MKNKLLPSLEEAIRQSGLRDGMTISFHHHFREGDLLMNQVMTLIDRMGFRDLTVSASSFFNAQASVMMDLIRRGVVTGLECNYMAGGFGKEISRGILKKPVIFRSHGGRDAALWTGECHIDVAFIGAPSADPMGNMSAATGPAACGTLGYAGMDAVKADKVIAITDHLVPYPALPISIPEQYVDYVVQVEKIGDPKGIVSGSTKITKDPVALCIARYASSIIEYSGLLDENFVFQTGAGGISLAAAHFLKELMLKKGVQGAAIIGGITEACVDLLECGCFRSILDTQCFDLKAIESIQHDPRHMEMSIFQYASPAARSTAADSLSAVVLGATEIDLDFNVNVHTDSNGFIIGGSGGHTDVAAGAEITMITAPLIRARQPIVSEHVTTVSTPGKHVDVLVTQYGIAVNPARPELKARLKAAGLPIVSIGKLKRIADEMCGTPKPLVTSDEPVAEVLYRTKTHQDWIYKVLT